MNYRLNINRVVYSWADPYITGLQIKELVSVDPSHGVWQLSTGPTDPAVGDHESVLIDKPGMEAFFTGPRLTNQGSGSAGTCGVLGTDSARLPPKVPDGSNP